MDPRNSLPSVLRAYISREGRHISVLRENHVLSVFRFQPSAESELVKPIWEVENVRSTIWHHEESVVLLSKRNGDLEWKSFRRNSSSKSGRLAAEQLLKHLILKRLEFDSLKQILCLSFQRDFCILQTSAKQIAGLRWNSDQETDIIWALEVGEFAVWCFCDKLFVNFEPHTKSLHLYHLFEGKIKHNVQLQFSDSLAISPVRQISACPDGKVFAVLTDHLLIGKKSLQLLWQDGKNVSEMSMGTSCIAVFTKQPEEYLLFNLTTLQKIYSCRIDVCEIIIFAQRYDRVDKAMKMNFTRDLKDSEKVDVLVSIDVRASLLRTALNSQHLESTSNILKIAEQGNEAEVCEILRVLDNFLKTNLIDPEKLMVQFNSVQPFSSKKDLSPSQFCLQILGLSLGFAGRAYKKFPDCATIFNLIFAWQELLPIKPQEPSIFQGEDLVRELAVKWQGWDEYSIIKDALIHNRLPLAQHELSGRDDCNFRELTLIQKAVIGEIQQNIISFDARSIEEAETMITNLGCDVPECWKQMCLQVDKPQQREKLVEIMRQRHLWTEELTTCLDFIVVVERFVRDSLGNTPVLTIEVVSGWSPEQRRLYLAESFLQSRNEEILAKIYPEDVWQVMLNKQILCSLRKWIENQSPSSHTDDSFPYSWPISSVMVDMAAECTNNDTRDSVLNLLANQGIFAECERQNLVAFVSRLLAINQFHQMENIIKQPLSNITLQSITAAALNFCANQFKPELFYDLISEQILDLDERPTWMKLAQRFQSWNLDSCDVEGFLELCRLNNTLLKEADRPTEEEFWASHPFVAMFFHLMNPSLLPNGTVTKALKSLTILAHACEQNHQDPSIRQLLVGEVPINVHQFFKQPQKEWDLLEHPHSPRNAGTSANHGLITSLDWTFYLRQSRPFRAFFHLQAGNKLAKEDSAMYPFAIQAICLEDPWNKAILQSCVLLIEMLGFNSHPLRTTLAALDRIMQDPSVDRKNMVEVCHSLLTDVEAASGLSDQLESCLLKNDDPEVVNIVDTWHLAVEFNTVYGLDLPIQFARQCANRNQWLAFLLFIQNYNYPLEKYWELLAEFPLPMKLHLQLAMKLERSEDTNQSPSPTSALNMASPTEAFYRLLLRGSPPNISTGSHLLTSSLANRSIELAVLTAVLEPQQIFSCLCVYLSLILNEKLSALDDETTPAIPDAETLSCLVLTAMSSNQFDIVLEAFHIFVPNHLLTRILDWINSFLKGQARREELELIRDGISLYEEGDELILFRQSMNLFRFALHILSWSLCYLIHDAEQQQELLTMWAEVQPFASLAVDVSVPDFGLLAEIVTLCVDSGIDVNIVNLMQGSGSLQFQNECQQAVEVLLAQRHFSVALKLAKMADLPADSIFVTQLSTMLDSQSHQLEPQTSSIRFRTAFWNRCHQLLAAHRVRPDIASAFFRDTLPRALSSWESHLMVDHAVNWMRLVKPTPKEALGELEVLWWKTKIDADIDGTLSTSLLDLQPNSPTFCPLLMAKVSEMADALPYAIPQSAYSDTFLEKVSEWIGRNLDTEDLIGALKLSSMFRRQSLDVILILFLIDLVENAVDVAEAKERLLKITQLKDKEVEWKDRQSVIDYVDSELLQHGHRLSQRLSVFHQVAVTLDLKYDYVVEHSRPISILKMLLETPNQSGLPLAIGGHLNLARSWITASRIASVQVVALVKDELIEAARSAHGQVSGTETNMVLSLLRGTFNRWVTLCADPTQLGRALFEAALNLEQNNEWPVAVELLIFAHSSFTLACDVENIGQILSQARLLIDKLLLDQQWILITRLTTGIQRYTEMSYVFALLKEHDQFEYLLRKGMDRLPLLRQALLDFLRPNCVENRELFRLVALHFHMHAEVASMWMEEANGILKPVIDQSFKSILRTTKKPVGSPMPKAGDSSPIKKSSSGWSLEVPQVTTAILPMLKATPEVKKILTAAMHNLAHAAEYYLQAGKLNHANRCALQAELVALQIHLVSRAAEGHQIYCILGLNAAQVDLLVCETLTYPEAEIISRSYGFNITWGKALMRHYILNDGSDYLARFVRRHTINSALVEEVVAAFEQEAGFSKKSETLDRLSHLVSMLTDVEAKYRLASRLGLRHLVSELLSSSALPYLKDTAWGKKANQD